MLQLSRTTAPASGIINLEEAKAQLKITHTVEDDLLNGYIAAVDSFIDGPDGHLGRAVVSQTWAHTFCFFPSSYSFPLSPVQSVVSITYYDVNDEQQTLDVSDFYLTKNDFEATLTAKSGVSLPSVFNRPDAVTITFIAGFTEVPATIKQAALMLVTHWFENRSAVIVGVGAQDVPKGVDVLLNMHRTGWIA